MNTPAHRIKATTEEGSQRIWFSCARVEDAGRPSYHHSAGDDTTRNYVLIKLLENLLS